jgi:alpha/beta hydrolase fold
MHPIFFDDFLSLISNFPKTRVSMKEWLETGFAKRRVSLMLISVSLLIIQAGINGLRWRLTLSWQFPLVVSAWGVHPVTTGRTARSNDVSVARRRLKLSSFFLQHQYKPRQPLSSVVLSLQQSTKDDVTTATTTSSSSRRGLYPPWTDASCINCHCENGSLSVENGFHTLFYQIYSQQQQQQKHPTTTTTNEISTTNTAKNSSSPIAVALFLHGGPGAGCFPNHVRFFDPQRYDRVILLDQRGCGHSHVIQSNQLHHHNTLLHLVDDIETLRQHLDIDQWTTILGGSWGSTLALAYAQEYPHRVYSLILRGVCTMRQSEVDWLFAASATATTTKSGNSGILGSVGSAAQLFPSSWNEFESAVCNVEMPVNGNNSSSSYNNRINGDIFSTNVSYPRRGTPSISPGIFH